MGESMGKKCLVQPRRPPKIRQLWPPENPPLM
jgi:hypothetical protein